MSVCSSKNHSSDPLQTWRFYCLGPECVQCIFGSLSASQRCQHVASIAVHYHSRQMNAAPVVLWKRVSGLRRSFMHCGRGLCVVIVVSLPLLPSVLSMCCMLLWSLVFRSLLVYVLFCFPFYFDRSFSHDSCLDFTSCFYKFLHIFIFHLWSQDDEEITCIKLCFLPSPFVFSCNCTLLWKNHFMLPGQHQKAVQLKAKSGGKSLIPHFCCMLRSLS